MKINNAVPFQVFDQEARSWLTSNRLIGKAYSGDLKVYRGTYLTVEQECIDTMTPENKFICFKSTLADQESEAYKDFHRRLATNSKVPNHPNVLGINRSFTREGKLFGVFPLMSLGSMRSIMRKYYQYDDGLPETFIAVVLRETLKGLAQIHRSGQVHREISAAQILLGKKPEIRLAFSASLHDYSNLSRLAYIWQSLKSYFPFSYLPHSSISQWGCAPEVFESENNVYTPKADIWLIGVTALELGYGGIKVRSRDEFEMIVDEINEEKTLRPRNDKIGRGLISCISACVDPQSPTKTKNELSDKFLELVLMCLAEDPRQRPTADELLEIELFAETKEIVVDQQFFNEYLGEGFW